jgi:hypothetical protein
LCENVSHGIIGIVCCIGRGVCARTRLPLIGGGVDIGKRAAAYLSSI